MAPQINRVGDLTIFVERPASPKGKPPVLLIHGMFLGAWCWDKYQAQLAQSGYESHAMNLRGHHGSRPVPSRTSARCWLRSIARMQSLE